MRRNKLEWLKSFSHLVSIFKNCDSIVLIFAERYRKLFWASAADHEIMNEQKVDKFGMKVPAIT